MKISFEIKCCPIKGRYLHWKGREGKLISLHQTKQLETKLLYKGHRNVVILEVIRRAKSISQPLPDAGACCRQWYGSNCELRHVHKDGIGESA